MHCTRREIRQFAEDAKALGVQYIGLCCGNSPAFTREVAEVYGRTPGSSEYKPDMSNTHTKSNAKLQSYAYGVDEWQNTL